ATAAARAKLRRGVAEAGCIEGRSVTIEYRWAEGRNDRLPALAEVLVHRQATVIVATGSLGAVLAAKAATSTIPIVFVTGVDPVNHGLVASFNRPGGNLTGVNFRSIEVASKRIQFVSEFGSPGDDNCLSCWRFTVSNVRGADEQHVCGGACTRAAAHCPRMSQRARFQRSLHEHCRTRCRRARRRGFFAFLGSGQSRQNLGGGGSAQNSRG